MPTLCKLSAQECAAQLKALNRNVGTSWEISVDSKLTKILHFDDFIQAWAFMSKLALYAEKNNHHPEWSNVYNTVSIELTTHDVGGISYKDFDFAGFVENYCLK